MTLYSKRTVGHLLRAAANIFGPLHVLKADENVTLLFEEGSQRLSLELHNRNAYECSTYVALHNFAGKLDSVRHSDEQPSVGLELDHVSMKISDLGLSVVHWRRQSQLHFFGRLYGGAVAAPTGSRVSISGPVDDVTGHRRIIIEGPKNVLTPQLDRMLRETVSSHEDSLREAARLEAHHLAAEKAKKAIRARALSSLSTWEFSQKHREQLAHFETRIVGQHHRDAKSQAVLAGKRVGNMVLFVREPDNEVDSNAVMVMAWDHGSKSWFHVGYVPADQASLIRSRWTVNPYDVAVGSITAIPPNANGHRKGPSIQVEFTGEMRSYPSFRG